MTEFQNPKIFIVSVKSPLGAKHSGSYSNSLLSLVLLEVFNFCGRKWRLWIVYALLIQMLQISRACVHKCHGRSGVEKPEACGIMLAGRDWIGSQGIVTKKNDSFFCFLLRHNWCRYFPKQKPWEQNCSFLWFCLRLVYTRNVKILVKNSKYILSFTFGAL